MCYLFLVPHFFYQCSHSFLKNSHFGYLMQILKTRSLGSGFKSVGTAGQKILSNIYCSVKRV